MFATFLTPHDQRETNQLVWLQNEGGRIPCVESNELTDGLRNLNFWMLGVQRACARSFSRGNFLDILKMKKLGNFTCICTLNRRLTKFLSLNSFNPSGPERDDRPSGRQHQRSL